ncbi:MAG: hypothetical protein M3Q44_01050 [bacterium]|nr:hypothetical protein [bacterium]
MNSTKVIKNYIQLQKDIMFNKLFEVDGATVCYSQNTPSPFWNNAFVDTILNAEQLNTIGNTLKSLSRSPAVYFENKSELVGLKTFLEEQGYIMATEDSFMFYENSKAKQDRFECVRKVETVEDLEAFLDTFDRSYRKEDPLNPYGELGDYLTAARVAWEKHHISSRIEYFVVYKNDEPVAVSTLTNYGSIGYISNVGSILPVRGEGYGKLATLYCVSQSQRSGNIMNFLITEEGTNPHSFYTSIGFKTKFTAYLMVQQS